MAKLPSALDLGERPRLMPNTGVTPFNPNTGYENAPDRALGQLAGTLEGVQKEIERTNLSTDTIRAEDAFNKLRSKQMDLSTGEDGFTKRRGQDAATKPVMEEYGKRFETATNDISNSLSNDQQRNLFLQRAQISNLQFKQDMLNHVTREKDIYESGVYKGTMDLEMRNAIERYRDQNGINLAITRMTAAVDQEGQHKGWSPEVINAEKANAISKTNRGVIERMLANDDDLTASAYYARNKKMISGDDSISVEKMLEIGSTRGESQRQADRIMAASKGDTTVALQVVRSIQNPKVRQATTALVKDMISEDRAAEKDRADEAFTHALTVVNGTGSVDRIEPDVQVRLSPVAMAALDARATELKQGKQPVNDDKAWAQFYTIARDSKALASMKDEDFYGNYWLKLDEPRRERAAALREAAIGAHKGDKAADQFLRNDVNLGELVKNKVFGAGLVAADKKPSAYSEEDKLLLSNVELEASKQLEKFQQESKRKATTAEEEKIVNSILLPQLKVRIDKPLWFDPSKKVSELTPDERQNAYFDFKQVPVDDRDVLAARARILGATASEDQIAKAYSAIALSQGLPAADVRARVDAILRGK